MGDVLIAEELVVECPPVLGNTVRGVLKKMEKSFEVGEPLSINNQIFQRGRWGVHMAR